MASESTIAVLGAGSWGTALAQLFAINNHKAIIYGINADEIDSINNQHKNPNYLPDLTLSGNISATTDIEHALTNSNEILIAVPSSVFRQALQQLKPWWQPKRPLLWATKGLEPGSNFFLHQVVEEELQASEYGVISGPSFANEVAKNQPTAVSLATNSQKLGKHFIKLMQNPHFKISLSSDIVGVELGGAVKNVIAVAAGIADGLGFGMNTRAALITKGLEEIVALGQAVGASAETLFGLSGLGDLILTASDDQSRNRRFGLALAAGKNVEEATKDIGQVVEGVDNVKQVYQMAQKSNVVMPITTKVYQIVSQNIPAKAAITAVFSD